MNSTELKRSAICNFGVGCVCVCWGGGGPSWINWPHNKLLQIQRPLHWYYTKDYLKTAQLTGLSIYAMVLERCSFKERERENCITITVLYWLIISARKGVGGGGEGETQNWCGFFSPVLELTQFFFFFFHLSWSQISVQDIYINCSSTYRNYNVPPARPLPSVHRA